MFDYENENYTSQISSSAAPLSMDSATDEAENKKSVFKMRLTPEQLSTLHARARHYGLSTADLVRFTMLGPDSCNSYPCKEQLVGIERELARWGNNLNQAQKAANEASKAGILSLGDLKKINSNLAAVRRLRRELKAQISAAMQPKI